LSESAGVRLLAQSFPVFVSVDDFAVLIRNSGGGTTEEVPFEEIVIDDAVGLLGYSPHR
jgi:hypothetical protein